MDIYAWGGHYWGWGGGPWFLLFPLFWIAVIVALGFVFRRRAWWYRQQGHSAEALLAERFARGEINDEEYRTRLSVLAENRRR